MAEVLSQVAAVNAASSSVKLTVAHLETKNAESNDAATARKVELVLGAVDLDNRDEIHRRRRGRPRK